MTSSTTLQVIENWLKILHNTRSKTTQGKRERERGERERERERREREREREREKERNG